MHDDDEYETRLNWMSGWMEEEEECKYCLFIGFRLVLNAAAQFGCPEIVGEKKMRRRMWWTWTFSHGIHGIEAEEGAS